MNPDDALRMIPVLVSREGDETLVFWILFALYYPCTEPSALQEFKSCMSTVVSNLDISVFKKTTTNLVISLHCLLDTVLYTLYNLHV